MDRGAVYSRSYPLPMKHIHGVPGSPHFFSYKHINVSDILPISDQIFFLS